MSKKFLIYKGSGGMAHMLRGLGDCIKIARASKRYLVIDCKINKGFGCNFSEFFKINNLEYSDNYEVIPKNLNYKGKNIDEIKKTKISAVKKNYFIFDNLINRIDTNTDDDILIYGGTGSNKQIIGLKIIPDIMKKLNSEPTINTKYIAVHFRNTDVRNSFVKFISKIKKQIKITKINTIYWSSDDCNSYDKMVKMIPEANFIRYTIPQKTKKNLHTETKDKYKQIYECLKDIYFILKSDYFIPSLNSGMSLYIKLMIQDENMFDIKSKTIILE